MGWFESSKEKQLRELIESKMDICLKKPNQYADAIKILNVEVSKSNQKAIEIIVAHIKEVIKEDDYDPQQKVRAITLLRDLMETHNKALGKYVVTKILKRLTILAQHRKNQKDENRGANIFKCKKSQEKYGIEFLRILLLCIADWGQNWPRHADGPFHDFNSAYNDLLVEKEVMFPPEEKRPSKSPIPKMSAGSRQDFTSPSPPKVGNDKKIISHPLSKPTIRERAPATGAFAEYLNEMIEILNLLSSTLTENTQFGEIWAIIKEFVRQVEAVEEKGNLIVASMIEKGDQNEEVVQAIQDAAAFVADLKKDTGIVDRKNQSYTKFNVKYIKNCKKLVLSLSIFLEKPGSNTNTKNASSLNGKQNNETSINQKVEEARNIEKPKAQAQRNRYGSSYQLRNQLQINLQPIKKEDFNSGTLNKGNDSEGSSRFNSITGNRISAQFNSPKELGFRNSFEQNKDLDKQRRDSDKSKEEENSKEDGKRKISKITERNQNQNQSSFQKMDFQNVPERKNGGDDAFGEFEVGKQERDSNQDFFKEIENKDKTNGLPKGTRNRKIQNKINAQENANNNYFDNSIKSNQQVSGLSGFDKSKLQSNSQSNSQSQEKEAKQKKDKDIDNSQSQLQSREQSKLSNQKKQSQESGDNSRSLPSKGFDTFKSPNQLKNAIKQLVKEEDNKSQKSNVSNPFEKPDGVDKDNPFQSQVGQKSVDRSQMSDNPFATKYQKPGKNNNENPFASKGETTNKQDLQNPFESKIDFEPKEESKSFKSKSSNPFSSQGNISRKEDKNSMNSASNLPRKPSLVENPFEDKSQKSKQVFEPQRSNKIIDNPFEEKSQISKRSIDRVDNPFQQASQKLYKNADNPFEERSQISRKNVDNPFDDKSQKQKPNIENPFGEDQNPFGNTSMNNSMVSNPFEKETKKPISQSKSLSQRDSFVNPKEVGNKNAIPIEDPFFEPTKEPNLNKSKQKSQQRNSRKEEKESFQGFGFDDFGNVSKSKSQTSSVKQGRRESQEQKQNESGFNFSQFGDVRNSKEVSYSHSSKNFFEEAKQVSQRKSIEMENSFDVFEKPKQNKNQNTVPAEKDFNDPFGMSSNNNKQDNVVGEQKKKNNISEQSKSRERQSKLSQNKAFEGFNFDDFENIPNQSQLDRSSNSNIFKEFDKSKQKTQSIKKEEPESHRMSDEWNNFGKASPNASDLWNKFQNIGEKQSSPSHSEKNEQDESKYEESENKSQPDPEQRTKRDKQVPSLPEIIEPIPSSKIPRVIFENEKPIRFGEDKSISINFEQPSPFQKKEISWQYTQFAMPSSFRYNVKPEQIAEKKEFLQACEDEYNEKRKKFQQMNEFLAMLKKNYASGLEKLGETRVQNRDFQIMLKHLKEKNRLKQLEIEDMIKKVRKAEEIKTQILEKERQLYERMRGQKRVKQQSGIRHKAGNKWQRFNNNLQKKREMVQMERSVSYVSQYYG